MNRKFGALALAALLAALTLTACGGSAKGDTAAASPSGSMDSAYEMEGGYGGGEDFGGLFYSQVQEPEAAPPDEGETNAGEDRLANAKMIYSASIEAQTMEFDTCAADLETLVEQTGGYLEYASAHSYGDGYRSGSYTARIPAARFTLFLKSVGDIAHVTWQEKSSENISEAYYDLESRLTTQRTKMERLQALLARAENMEDIITIESAIAETEYQIEQLTGSLRHYDALVDFSTIQIQLREVARLSDVETTPPSFSARLSAAFSGGLVNFGDFLQELSIFAAYNWIWLVILAGIVLLAAKAVRRRAERQAGPSPEEERQGFSLGRKKREDANQEDAKKPDDKQPKD